MRFFLLFGRVLHSLGAGFSGVTKKLSGALGKTKALSAQPQQTTGREVIYNPDVPIFSFSTCSKPQPHHYLPGLLGQRCPGLPRSAGRIWAEPGWC